MPYTEPHTHPLRPTLSRNEVDPDVLALAEEIRDILKNEELWHILMRWKSETLRGEPLCILSNNSLEDIWER